VTRRHLILAPLLMVCAAAGSGRLFAKDRLWQQGIWRDVQVSRPKIVFGATPTPMGPPGQSGLAETRSYVIETGTLRLELRDRTTSDAPSLGATAGDPVTFALEGNTVYVKDVNGREHGIHVTKKTPIKKQ
jgi:hypothetical protein